MPSRRRSSAPGGGSTASRAARRSARGSTGSRRTSASTCSADASAARGPMDLGPAREPIEANLNTLPEVTWIQPIPDDPGGDVAGRTRDDPARARRRAPAPAAPPARRPDPLRGAALAGDRGRRAARDERRVRQQRAPAGARDARGERSRHARHVAAVDEADARAPRALRRGLRALRHRRAHVADPGGRDPVDAAVRPLAARPRRHLHLVVGPGNRLQGLACDPDGRRRTARPRSASTSRATGQRLRAVGAAGARDRQTAGSSSSRSSSTPRRSSRSSAYRPGSTPSTFAQPHERDQFEQLGRRMAQPKIDSRSVGAARASRASASTVTAVGRRVAQVNSSEAAHLE